MANGEYSRKQPWNVRAVEPWASELVEASHTEVLWMLGEPCLFTMMWRPQDFKAGLVDRCSECYGRSAQAFQQPERKKCPTCFGTTFEGGIRAQIIRPALFTDRNAERVDTKQGTVDLDGPMVETLADFFFTKGDYIFRGDGSRYQGEEKGEGVLRTGYAMPHTSDSFRGTIPTARLEDPTSLAFFLPPSVSEVKEILAGPPRVEDISGTPVPIYAINQTFTFTAEDTWVVMHNLGIQYPGTVLVVDNDDNMMIGEVEYQSLNTIVVSWPGPVSGKVIVKP